MLRDAPLTPSPDEARSSLRRELLKPEYNDQNLVQRLLDEIQRLLTRAVDAASAASPVQTLIAMAALIGLVGAAAWLVSRARADGRPGRHPEPVLPAGEHVSAAELRARAEAALGQGRHAEALVDAFRALTLHQIEDGRLVDAPGATAREVARALATTYPAQGDRVSVTAGRFDSVLYGDRPATADQARDVLVLDDDLRGRP